MVLPINARCEEIMNDQKTSLVSTMFAIYHASVTPCENDGNNSTPEDTIDLLFIFCVLVLANTLLMS